MSYVWLATELGDKAHKKIVKQHIADSVAAKTCDPSHLDKHLRSNWYGTRYSAMKNPQATKAHLTQGLADAESDVRAAAIDHPNADTTHLDTAMKDSSSLVRFRAITHPKATESHLLIGTQDSDQENANLAKGILSRRKTLAAQGTK